MSTTTVNVLYTPGTNSHKETMWAFERVGAKTNLMMMSEVLRGDKRLDDADILAIPGGWSYGDHIGAGAIAGQLMKEKLADQIEAVKRKPIIAICNGFQIAARAGLFGTGVALTPNIGGFKNIVFQEHIVEPETNSVWLSGLQGSTIRFSCAHGEGRFVYEHNDGWRVALRYPEGKNPDGSTENIGGIASEDGLLFGLMDHPERVLDEPGALDIFANGVKAAAC